jgi:hypothetical protein
MAGTGGATQIADVRAAADGAVNNLPVHGVFVTYTKPLLGQDAAGFFVQATAAGPAVFVAVDPATLPTPVKVGDKIDFDATMVATVSSLKEVTGIANLVIVTSNNPIAPLVTDVGSATDLVTNVDMYESRAIRISGSLAANFIAAGAPQVATPIATMGLTDPNLRLRMPDAIRAQYGLGAGCTVTADYGVMWRFNTVAQPSVYDPTSLKNMTCAPPTVVNAVPLSQTQVVVNFDRPLDPNTVQASDFTFTGGLMAQNVMVNGTAVTITTTAQTGGTSYTVTAATLNDVLGTPIGTPNTAMFNGYSAVAGLLFNEINPNIGSSHDLIELLVTQSGSTNGITILQKGTVVDTLATLPDVNVTAGDLIVVHLVPATATGAAPASETTSKTQYANAMYSANYDGAWDFLGGTTGLSYSNRVLEIDAPGGVVLDALPVVLSSSANPPAAFPGTLQALQSAGLWLPPDCGGMLCTYTSTPTAVSISVDYLGAGTTPTGNSISRKPGMNTKQKSDWNAAGPQSFGLPNP